MRFNVNDKYWWSKDGLVSIAIEDIWWRRPKGTQGTPDTLAYKKNTWWVFPKKGYSYKVLATGEASTFEGAFRAARYWIRQNQNLVYGE